MTDDKIALREVPEKGSDATFLREMIGFAAQRLLPSGRFPRCWRCLGRAYRFIVGSHVGCTRRLTRLGLAG